MRDKFGRFKKGSKINLGRKHTKESKENNRQAHLGLHNSPETEFKKGKDHPNYGKTSGMKGKHHTKAWKKELSKRMKGKIPKGFILLKLTRTKVWNDRISKAKKGHVVSKATREKISIKNKDKKRSIETRKKMSMYKGSERYNWKGTTPLIEQIRKCFEYKYWRESIFVRDNYTCQKCDKKGGYLEAHHNEKSFQELFVEFFREYNQFSPFEDIDTLVRLAMNWKPFWIAKGETLCKKCHDKTKNGRKLCKI